MVTIRVEPRPFAAACAWVARRLPSKPQVPVLAGVLLELVDGRLNVSAFDYDTSVTARLDAVGEDSGRLLVSGRLLALLTKDLPDKPVEISAAEGMPVTLQCGRVKLTLPQMMVSDYPTLPALPPALGTVDAAEFVAAVERAWVAADHRDQRKVPEFTGIHLTFGDVLELWSTDRYRAAVGTTPWKGGEGTALVPCNVLSEAAKAMDGEVSVHLGGGLIGLASADRTVVARLLAGEFPTIPQGFPDRSQTPARVSVAELSVALRRADQVRQPMAPAALSFADGVLTVAAAGDNGGAEEEIDCGYAGPEIAVNVNPLYLLDAITAIRSPYAELSMTHKRAVLVTGDDDYRHLVMTINLR